MVIAGTEGSSHGDCERRPATFLRIASTQLRDDFLAASQSHFERDLGIRTGQQVDVALRELFVTTPHDHLVRPRRQCLQSDETLRIRAMRRAIPGPLFAGHGQATTTPQA